MTVAAFAGPHLTSLVAVGVTVVNSPPVIIWPVALAAIVDAPVEP